MTKLAQHFTPDELRERLDYDEVTGNLYWRRDAGDQAIAGTVTPYGYLQIAIGGHSILAHRAIWAMHFGEWPDGMIDHRNRIKTDNRISNLRLATTVQNSANTNARSNSKSGVKGVSQKPNGKWRAYIRFDGKNRALGTFANMGDAIEVYNRAAREVHGDFAAETTEASC